MMDRSSSPEWAPARPASHRSASPESQRSRQLGRASEQTPLLTREERPQEREEEGEELLLNGAARSNDVATASLRSAGQSQSQKKSRRWPSIAALLTLCLLIVVIIIGAFFVPSMVQEYAMQAMVFEPESVAIDSFTATGVRARVQGDFHMDASKVRRKSIRDIGRFATWFAKEVESGESRLGVSLPEYGNLALGYAVVPPIKLNIRNGHDQHLDFITSLEPGEVEGIRRIANDWIEGRLGQLRVQGKIDLALKSGLFSLGRQSVTQTMVFSGQDISLGNLLMWTFKR